ncbi:MAG: hypothetical protein ACRDRX_17925 [Pseudonocardiaceae bacterium]
MSTVLTPACLDQQHAELLPARTVLSMFAARGPGSGGSGGSGGGGGDGLGQAIAKMFFSTGGNSTPGPDGADGHPNPND